MSSSNGTVIGKVVQVSGPAVDCEFPEGQIPLVYTAIRITSQGFTVPNPIDIICEVQQHIGEGRVRTVALQPTEGLVRGMEAINHKWGVTPRRFARFAPGSCSLRRLLEKSARFMPRCDGNVITGRGSLNASR